MLPLLALRYNLATSQLVVCILTNLENTERESINLKWDLAPSLAEHPSIGHNFINARVEQVAAKPFFRQTFKQQQCLILTDGFFSNGN
jgi:putative SOS response-associated peptidase YedK